MYYARNVSDNAQVQSVASQLDGSSEPWRACIGTITLLGANLTAMEDVYVDSSLNTLRISHTLVRNCAARAIRALNLHDKILLSFMSLTLYSPSYLRNCRYNPTGDSVDWNLGPNSQFYRFILWLHADGGSWGPATPFFYMEGDTVPRKPFWLDAIRASAADKAPFSVLGSRYRCVCVCV